MDAKAKAQLMQSVKDKKGAKDLRLCYEEFIKVEVEESKKGGDLTEYLLLVAWKKKGFPCKKIKRNCNDTKIDAVLGKVYGVTAAQKEELEAHRSEVRTI